MEHLTDYFEYLLVVFNTSGFIIKL